MSTPTTIYDRYAVDPMITDRIPSVSLRLPTATLCGAFGIGSQRLWNRARKVARAVVYQFDR
ncbi:MAG: hypothetical protein MI861_12820 [Pirellulales bacterium]|nr:hypothetical protein [Pirellulales bacterium]